MPTIRPYKGRSETRHIFIPKRPSYDVESAKGYRNFRKYTEKYTILLLGNIPYGL